MKKILLTTFILISSYSLSACQEIDLHVEPLESDTMETELLEETTLTEKVIEEECNEEAVGITGYYTKKCEKVYFNATEIQEADADSFKTIKSTGPKGRAYKSYARDHKHIFCDGNILNKADTESFYFDNSKYLFKDKNDYYKDCKVYDVIEIGSELISETSDGIKIHTESFKEITNGFYKDKNHIYFVTMGGLERVPNADSNSFEVIENSKLYKDKNHVYGFKLGMGAFPFPIENADPNSFQTLGYLFGKDKNNVYFNINSLDVDKNSFEVLDEYYSKDNSKVYFQERLIKNADPKSFQLITDNPDYGNFSRFSKDKNNVYYLFSKIENLDPNNYEFIGYNLLKDDNNIYTIKSSDMVFTEFEIVDHTNIDARSFRHISKNYYKDKNKTYVLDWGNLKEIDDNNTGELQTLDYNFSKNNNNVFWNGKLLGNVDAASFKAISYKYSKDKNNVYSFTTNNNFEVLENADPNTFVAYEAINHSTNQMTFTDYALDKNHVYKKTTILEGVEPSTFELVDTRNANQRNFFIDKDHIYYSFPGTTNFQILDNIDKESFELINAYFAKDKNNVYLNGTILVEGADPDTFQSLDMLSVYTKDKNNIYYKAINSSMIKVMQDVDIETFKKIRGNYAKDRNHIYYKGEVLDNANPETFTIE